MQSIFYSETRRCDTLQIGIQQKILFVTTFRFTISFLVSHFRKIPSLIRYADSFSPFYLVSFFEFGLRKAVEKCVYFIGYLVI